MNLTKNQLQRVNAVRDYYNVMWLSKVCTANGDYIRRGVYNGSELPNSVYKVTRVFLKQSRPDSYSWKFWRQVSSHQNESNNELKLKQPLSSWSISHSKSVIWSWYVNNEEELYYERTNVQNDFKWQV